jgi:hypothetical protein
MAAHGDSELAGRAVAALESLGCKRLIQASPAARRRAVVLFKLTGKPGLVLHWVRLQQLRMWKQNSGLAVDYDSRALDQWVSDWSEHPEVIQLLSQPLAPARQSLEIFAAEHETHVVVDRLHRRGLRVPAPHVVATYLAALAKRPMSASTRQHASRLQSRSVSSKKWGRAFRQRWGYEWGMGHLKHGVNPADTSVRAAVFLRWLHWTLEQLSGPAEPVVVNMDETMLSSVRPRKLGVVPTARACARLPAGHLSRETALPRTSLIATVCSDVALQGHLPQMRLPRARPDKIPGRRAQAAYAAAGRPQSTLHGSAGWNTSDSCCLWLRELAVRLRRVAPNRPIVLVVDDCSVHLSDVVLRKCCKLSIAVVVIPSRMTWLLQPLDTHVFAQLKSKIRTMSFAEAVRSEKVALSQTARIRIQGEAIRSVLVDQDWSMVMQRAGFAGPGFALREAVAACVRGLDLAPRRPTEGELCDVLRVPPCRAGRLQAALKACLDAARHARTLPAAAAVLPLEASSLPAPVRCSVVPRLRLGPGSRLPQAPPGCSLAATYVIDNRRRSPVVTRSRSAASLAAAAAAAAPAGSASSRLGASSSAGR